jgi:alkaline phosphatase D
LQVLVAVLEDYVVLSKKSKIAIVVLATVVTLAFLVLSEIIFFYPLFIYAQQNTNLFITHGVASGDVTDHSAVIWSRANKQAQMHVEYDTNSNFSSTSKSLTITPINVNETTDFTGHAKIHGLRPDTLYYYRVWFTTTPGQDIKNNDSSKGSIGSDSSSSITGTFRTSPENSTSKTVRFVIGGDLGGHRYCRRVDLGYPIFSIIKALSPDFFIFNGDQIYGDDVCPAHQGPEDVVGWYNIQGNFPSITDENVNWSDLSQLQDIYNKHWEYNRADPHIQSLLQNTSIYSQADDHEVVNDYGGNWSYLSNATKDRTGFPNLVKAGLQAFFNFSPLDGNNNSSSTEEGANRVYRSFNWGKDLELFLLDAHSYRSRSELIDTPENNKTLLGKAQFQWLEQSLLNSTATWKVISTDVPFTIPSCFTNQLGCDSWATNSSAFKKTFVRERNDLLKFLDDNNIKNVIFITTDVHFPANIIVDQDPNNDGDRIILYEIVCGPFAAITYPTMIPIDPTINATYIYHENKIFNFGYLKVQEHENDEGKAHLISEIRDQDGLLRPGSHLDLRPQ